MTDEQIIARNSQLSFEQCWIARRVAIGVAKQHRDKDAMRRHRRERRWAHNVGLLARKWLNRGAWTYLKPTDTRAVEMRENTEMVWVSLARHTEKYINGKQNTVPNE